MDESLEAKSSKLSAGMIIPAIMPDRLADIGERLSLVPNANAVQLDIMDGEFVQARSWPYGAEGGWQELEMLARGEAQLPKSDSVRYEAHLMLAAPEEAGALLAKAGVRALVAHVESFENAEAWHTAAALWRKSGATEIGISLRAETPAAALEDFLEQADFVQFMGIEQIGFQGEAFSLETIARVQDFHAAHATMPIAVDGGVSAATIHPLRGAGATRFVIGSALFGADDPTQAFKELQDIVDNG